MIEPLPSKEGGFAASAMEKVKFLSNATANPEYSTLAKFSPKHLRFPKENGMKCGCWTN